MKKKTREQLMLAAPAGIAAVIAVGATVHANGKYEAAREIQQQILQQTQTTNVVEVAR